MGSFKDHSNKSNQQSGRARDEKKKAGVEKRLTELEKKCEEYLDGWKRAQADYQNLKKNTEKQRANIVKFANTELIIELLEVYSNFKLAWNHLGEDQRKEPWAVGFGHIRKQLWEILDRQGVEEIKTNGERFDPERHEAVRGNHESRIMNQEDRKKNNKINNVQLVIREVQPGFTLHGRVIRPAKVDVK